MTSLIRDQKIGFGRRGYANDPREDDLALLNEFDDELNEELGEELRSNSNFDEEDLYDELKLKKEEPTEEPILRKKSPRKKKLQRNRHQNHL